MSLPPQLLEYLHDRLQNHSYSICHESRYLAFDPKGGARVTRSTIYVPLPYVLNKDTLELIYASEIHETAHILYSSVQFWRLKKCIVDNNLLPGLAKTLWNHIEDYRVNTLICYSHPGAGRILHRAFKKFTIAQNEDIYEPASALIYELEYRHYNRKFGEDGVKKLEEACALARGVVGCLDMEDTLKILPEIYKIFKPKEPETEVEKLWERKEDLEKFGGLDADEQDYEPSTPTPEVTKKTEEALKKKPAKEDYDPHKDFDDEMTVTEPEPELEEEETEPEDEETEIPETEEDETKKETEEEETEDEEPEYDASDDDGKGPDTGVDEASDAPEPPPPKDDSVDKTLEFAEQLMAELENIDEAKRKFLRKISKEVSDKDKYDFAGKIGHTIMTHIPPNNDYKSYVKKNLCGINKMVTEGKNILLFHRGYASGQRTGRLDSRKVYRVGTGDTKVFRKKFDNVKLGDIAFVILVDESGSMSGKKARCAMEATIVIHEVFRRLKIKHLIVGYTGDTEGYNTYHRVYHFWDDIGEAGNLINITGLSQNRDGPSIRLGIKYFQDVKAKKKVLVVISDGEPCACGYGGEPALEDTVQAHKEALKNNVKLINVGIGIGFDLPDEYLNRVKVDNVAELARRLMKVIKKEVM